MMLWLLSHPCDKWFRQRHKQYHARSPTLLKSKAGSTQGDNGAYTAGFQQLDLNSAVLL
jgi:hypothetical protein